jgi:hypothetical protein
MLKAKNYKTNADFFRVFLHISLLVFITNSGISQCLITEISDSGLFYSDLENWAAHPDKKDPSDSIPSPLRFYEEKSTGVDVFFIHPTTYTGKKYSGWNASINDEVLNHATDYSSILYQASVFNAGNRVFAPRYRQAHISAFYSKEDSAEISLEKAYTDVREAFLFYLNHYHEDRPIIIASHSQGTRHAGKLLKEFFENKKLKKKLVCAYIIGMPIPEKYFSDISPCKDSTETGCFVGWRTFKNKYTPEFIEKENFRSVVVNPLSWKTDDEYIAAKKNKGGVMMNFNKIINRVVDAQIHGNILWSCKPHIIGRIFIRQKNFHIGDINLFYLNIRENVKCRIKNYFLSHPNL